MTLETITGNLLAYKRLQFDTFQHVDQLMNERRANPILFDDCFYTADGHGYFYDGNKVVWAITREPQNLVLRHLDDAFSQLTTLGNYRPFNEEAYIAKMAPETVVINLSQLRLSGNNKVCDYEWRYLPVRIADGFIGTTRGYQAPNKEEQKVMQRLGYTAENLNLLHSSFRFIQVTRIDILNPAYVRKETRKNLEYNSLWMASKLDNFIYNFSFGADAHFVHAHINLRGVRKFEES